LQGTDLLILDESLAALDPQTLRRSLDFVVEEPPGSSSSPIRDRTAARARFLDRFSFLRRRPLVE